MKLLVVLTLVAVATAAAVPAAPETNIKKIDFPELNALIESAPDASPERNQILINVLVTQMFNYLRRIINQGSVIFGLPPLDPLQVDYYQMNLPAGLVNLDLEISDAVVKNFGRFVVDRSALRLNTMTFDLELTFPDLEISTERYSVLGDILTALPLYGDGHAKFLVTFKIGALLHLKQSDDEMSILIEGFERPVLQIVSMKTDLSGVIGGGDIDAIVNAVVDDVLVDYVNRFSGALSQVAWSGLVGALNPVLDTLDSWKYIRRWV